MSADLGKRIARWRGGADGFFRWVEDARPLIPSYRGGYEPFVPTDWQRRELEQALDPRVRTAVFCWPRRHSKTLAAALIVVWRFVTRPTQNCVLIANSDKQVIDVCFRLVRTILERTPSTAALIRAGTIRVGADRIEMPSSGSVIQGFPANPAALYGKKTSVAQISELHAARDDQAFQAIASSTIDSEDGLVLIDSTVGSRASPLYALYRARDEDPTLFFSHIQYVDLEDAVANAPPWVNADAIRSRARQMLPQAFAQQHLNAWTAGSSALFPPEVLDRCRGEYPLDAAELADGRAYHVGGGLDRAYAFSLHGDKTVTTAVLKVLGDDDEAHYYVLASDKVWMSQASGIRQNFIRYRKDFGLSRATFETPNTQDLAGWAADQDFEVESVFPSLERKASAYTALFNAARDGRLHVHPDFERLLSEMESFEYELKPDSQKGSVPRFHHARGARDDHLDSLAWGVYSLRAIELPAYEVLGVHCHSPELVRNLCVLFGGSLVPPCSETCRSFRNVADLYRNYRERHGPRALRIEEFATQKIVNTGSVSANR